MKNADKHVTLFAISQLEGILQLVRRNSTTGIKNTMLLLAILKYITMY